MHPRWSASPSVDVRRGWESQWTSIAEDVWETVAAIREEHPFPAPPLAGTDSALTADWLNAWNAKMACLSSPTSTGSSPSIAPKITPARRLLFHRRTWTLLCDHRRARITASHDEMEPVSMYVAHKLGREIRTMLESTLAVLYDLGYDESEPLTPQIGEGGSRVAKRPSPQASFATPVKTQVRSLLRRGSDPTFPDYHGGTLGSLIDVPEVEREAALGWVLQVLLTLRLHCGILLRMLSHQFRSLEDRLILGPKAIESIVAKQVRESFLHHGFYTELARAVASLEMPSRLGSRRPGDNVILLAMVPVVDWCFLSGLQEMVSTFAEELKYRWAHAAELMLEEMSPELTPVATARQLLCVIDHCNAMVASLGCAIGDIHAQAVRREIAVAVLCKDTVGLVVRSLFRSALAIGVAPAPPTSTSSPVTADPLKAAAQLPVVASETEDDDVVSQTGSYAWQSIEVTEADVSDLTASADALHRVLAEGVGISDVEDELVAAIAEHLNEVITTEESSREHAALALHFADAVGTVRRVLHVPLELNLLPASAKTAGARTRAVKKVVAAVPCEQVGPLFSHTECCIMALSRAAQQVVGSHTAALEESLAHALFDHGAHHVMDAREELVALCDYVQSTDRFVELCKHRVAARYLHISPEDDAAPSGDEGGIGYRAVAASKQQGRARLTAQDLLSLQTANVATRSATPATPAVAVPPRTDTAATLEIAWRRFDEDLGEGTVTTIMSPTSASPFAGQHPQSTILTGSVADSTEYGGAGGIVPVLEAHAALRRRFPAAVLSPLTSLLLELRHAYYVDSDTIASPFTQSQNDLQAVSQPPEVLRSELPRPRFEVLCRCLSTALWQGHVPVAATRHGDDRLLPLLNACHASHKALAPLKEAVDWLQRQYCATYPQRLLTWPALSGDLVMTMRLGDLDSQHGGFQVGGRAHRPTTKMPPVMSIHAVPALGTMLLHFNSKPSWMVAELAELMEPLTEAAVRRGLEYIASVSGVLSCNETRTVYSVVPVPPHIALVPTSGRVWSGSGRGASTSLQRSKVHLLGVSWADAKWDITPSLAPVSTAASDTTVGVVEATIAASRQRATEAAVVRVLKRARQPLTSTATFEAASESLRPYFVLDQRLFRRSMNVLLERDFIQRVENSEGFVGFEYVA